MCYMYYKHIIKYVLNITILMPIYNNKKCNESVNHLYDRKVVGICIIVFLKTNVITVTSTSLNKNRIMSVCRSYYI